jgi:PPOX class probable F420-dependent enzyme
MEQHAMDLDTSTDFGAMVARRLQEEQIGWLTTVDPSGSPQPTPIWFHWDGETILIFSEPKVAKVRNIRANPKVALSFNSDQYGGAIVVFTGQARIADAAPSEARLAAYEAKYAEGIKSLKMTPEEMLAKYSTVILVTPEKVRGWA